jgi:alpha-glucosidase (family GH31 glycosyl hydrolase)
VHAGGTVTLVEAALGQIPLFFRDGASLPITA